MQAAANAAGVALRPHAKTHKSPLVAALQIDAGAVGICCAKLGEAEVFADAGITDIRLPYPLQPANASRVLALQQRARVSFIVDDLAVARALVRGDGRRRPARRGAGEGGRRLPPLRNRARAGRRGRVPAGR